MTLFIALWFVLLLAQASAPATPQGSEPPAAQTSQQPGTQQVAPTKAHRPNPDADGKYHVGDGVTPPYVTHKVPPDLSGLPDSAKRPISGITIVRIMVDTHGNPQDIRVDRSMAKDVDENLRETALLLDKQALKTIRQYRFAPATYQGKPVPLEIRVYIEFEISK
jgi:TonB family protein